MGVLDSGWAGLHTVHGNTVIWFSVHIYTVQILFRMHAGSIYIARGNLGIG